MKCILGLKHLVREDRIVWHWLTQGNNAFEVDVVSLIHVVFILASSSLVG